MNRDLLVAHLNLYAVLQNIASLVALDGDTAQQVRQWRLRIQFKVRGGPAAYLTFENGACTHGRGMHAKPTITLFFLSPQHLNAMFAGTGTPIPLRGFTRLGFLKTEFMRLTNRLESFLRPAPEEQDEEVLRISTALTLYTAAHAVKELAEFEPTCRTIAARIPPGVLEISVQPAGPHVHLIFDDGGISVHKGTHARPTARMTFRDWRAAHALLTGAIDSFGAVAQGALMLHGLIPMIDDVGLILDRVEEYLEG